MLGRSLRHRGTTGTLPVYTEGYIMGYCGAFITPTYRLRYAVITDEGVSEADTRSKATVFEDESTARLTASMARLTIYGDPGEDRKTFSAVRA